MRLAPLQLESRVNLGSLLVRLGHADEGLSILREEVRAHPRYPPALYALADALDRTGLGGQGFPYLDTATRIDPFYPNAYYLRGKLLFETGHKPEAAVAMRKFLGLWDQEGPYRDAALRVIARAEQAEPGARGEADGARAGTARPSPPPVPASPLPPFR